MDETALFNITYGLYILSAEYDGKKNACIINTLNQVTQEPISVSITVLKSNLTHDMIKNSQKFSVSILSKNAELDTISRFGFVSGRNIDKLEDFPYYIDSLENPIIEKDCIATISCNVVEQIDMGTHTLFIGGLVEARNLEKAEPMTYAHYRDLKTGKVSNHKQDDLYQCQICHYVYDGDIPFEGLPDDYRCPLCNQPKSSFSKIK